MSTPSAPFRPLAAPKPAGALALLLGGAVCGFGLGALVLALPRSAPGPEVAVPPPPLAASQTAALTLDSPPPPASARPDWPALFGIAAPEPEPEPEPVVMDDEDDDWDEDDPIEELDARLKGVALDGAGGWALIETDERVHLVRPGTRLTPDHVVHEILSDAVILETPEGQVELRFDDPEPGEPLANRNAPRRTMAATRRDLDDRMRPGFMPRRDRFDDDDDWFDDDDDDWFDDDDDWDDDR